MTIKAAPQTVFNDLLERALLAVSNGASEMELKRIEREAVALAQVDASGAFEVRAHLAAIRGDADETDRLFEAGLLSSDARSGSAMRYLVLLAATGRSRKLYEQFERFRELLRNDPSYVKTLAELLVGTGWIYTADAFRAESSRMGIEFSSAAANRMGSRLDPALVSEAEVADAVGFAHAFLRKNGASPNAVESSVLSYEDGGAGVFYQFAIDQGSEQVAELEWQLFEALADQQLPVEQSGRLVFGLTAGTLESNANHV